MFAMSGSLNAVSIISGVIGGIASWFATDFIFRPVRQFFQLRGEICQAMVMFDNVRPGDLTKLEEARDAFRLLGARMLAFAHTEWLGSWLIVGLRYDPTKAGRSLIGVSNTISTAGEERHKRKQDVMAALRIKGL
jgi:hypothetical protein